MSRNSNDRWRLSGHRQRVGRRLDSHPDVYVDDRVRTDQRYPPVITITLPAISDRIRAEDRYIAIGGVAADDNRIVSVTWTNSRGGSGAATGTDVWLAGVVLHAGRNDITIAAIDQSGNRGVATVSIHRQLLGRRRLKIEESAQGSAQGD